MRKRERAATGARGAGRRSQENAIARDEGQVAVLLHSCLALPHHSGHPDFADVVNTCLSTKSLRVFRVSTKLQAEDFRAVA